MSKINRLWHIALAVHPRPSGEQLLEAFYEMQRINTKPDPGLCERVFRRRMLHGFGRMTQDRFSSYFPFNARIKEGLVLPHGFNGIHLAKTAEIGSRVTILQGVTIGAGLPSGLASPVIGNDVFIGAGAQIIGRCVIGDGARIGAGVVLVNVEILPGAVIVNKSAYDLTNKRFVYPQD